MSPSAAPQPVTPQANYVHVPLGGLPPALKNALSSLNVQLENELWRYRYAKRGDTQVGLSQQLQRHRQPLSPVKSPSRASHFQLTSNQQTVVPPLPPPNPRLQQRIQPVSENVMPPLGHAMIRANHVGTPPSEVSALRSALMRQPQPEPAGYLASSENLLQSFNRQEPEQETAAVMQSFKANWLNRLNTPLGLGALLLLLVASAGLGFVLVNPTVVRHLVDRTPLARIWPSSESEAESASGDQGSSSDEANRSNAVQGKPPSPLSPDLSQQEFSELDFNGLSTLPSEAIRSEQAMPPSEAGAPNERQSDDSAPSVNTQKAETPSGDISAPSGSDSPVSTTIGIPRSTTPPPVKPSLPSGPPVASFSAPVASPPSQAAPLPLSSTPSTSAAVPDSAAIQPSPPIVNEAPPPSSTPSTAVAVPDSTATQPPPPTVNSDSVDSVARDPAPSSGNAYYVVTDYTGDPSLNAAREVVGDAYLRNFEDGSFIQMGAFGEQGAAETLVETLQGQGIEAQVYTPE